jgi:hypothetical protein
MVNQKLFQFKHLGLFQICLCILLYINIYASFEECFDEEVDDFFGDDLTPKDSKTKIAATAELAILEKDSQMLTKRIQELRVKLNKEKI